ncbi:MAG: FMN-binding protein [Oscillospiraceae bacterium]|nr:FMN-binding protein [Oscillospiraceae bacterium]
MNNKVTKLALVLLLICAVTAGILGVVNALTFKQIAYNKMMKQISAFSAVLPSESGYTEVSFDGRAFPTVDSINQSNDGNGYVVTSTFSGAQGNITMACGVDNELKCTGISIIEHKETSGLGAVAASTSKKGVAFREQFIGQGADIALTKAGGTIDALAGATITSTAVTNATATSIAAVAALG